MRIVDKCEKKRNKNESLVIKYKNNMISSIEHFNIYDSHRVLYVN